MTVRRLAISIVVLAAVGVAGFAASREASFDLNYIAIEGGLSDAQRKDVLETLANGKNNIAELRDIKTLLEGQAWIDTADVMRRWPDSLVVNVVPERAIAYWNDDAFINDEGEVFTSRFLAPRDLAQLYGPKESERRVMQQYQQLSRVLGPSGQAIDVLTLDARGAWKFKTEQGITVELGKDDIRDRMQRFLLVIENADLDERLADIEEIDTRYSNGVAVGFKEAASLSVATHNSERDIRL